MTWEDMGSAPRDGTVILVETDEGFIASAAYWTLDMLREACPLTSFKTGDEYWSLSGQDECCHPLRWLKGFPMPQHIVADLD